MAKRITDRMRIDWLQIGPWERVQFLLRNIQYHENIRKLIDAEIRKKAREKS